MSNRSGKLTDFIYEVFEKIGTRPAGSTKEEIASHLVKTKLKEHSNEVFSETFKCNPRALQHLVTFLCSCYCIALLMYPMYPLATFLIIIFSLTTLIFARMFDIQIVDFFMKKKISQNVFAKIKPKLETKRILIFSAHIDSPYVMKLFEEPFRKYTFLIKNALIFLFISLALISFLDTFKFIPIFTAYFYVIPFVGILLIIFFQFLIVTYDESFGANDNLSGVTIILELAKYLFYNRLQNTEIWICVFGAEEPGTVGSNFFVREHYKELKDKAMVLNLDSVANGDLYVITKEPDVRGNHDKNMINIVLSAGKISNIKIEERIINGGSTDATPFSWEKIPATSIVAMDENGIPIRYHVKDDLPQYISDIQLQDVYKICVGVANIIDGK